MRKIFILLLLVNLLFSEEIGELTFSNDYKKGRDEETTQKTRGVRQKTSSSCRWCRKFESTTLTDWTVAEKLEGKYLGVNIDRDNDYFPKHLKHKRVPRHYFLTPDEQVIYTFLGYWNVEDFTSYVDDVDWQYSDKLKKGIIK